MFCISETTFNRHTETNDFWGAGCAAVYSSRISKVSDRAYVAEYLPRKGSEQLSLRPSTLDSW